MKCKHCDGKGYAYVRTAPNPITGYGYKRVCDYCHGTGEIKQTNEEWFCQLPTGEKAEFFANIYPKSVGEALIKISNGDKEKWEEWLKEKHNE